MPETREVTVFSDDIFEPEDFKRRVLSVTVDELQHKFQWAMNSAIAWGSLDGLTVSERTCHRVTGVNHGCCSECGHELYINQPNGDDGRYCPGCGARVVEE
jgi:hypothetical protein